jgi:hypothetical protein
MDTQFLRNLLGHTLDRGRYTGLTINTQYVKLV